VEARAAEAAGVQAAVAATKVAAAEAATTEPLIEHLFRLLPRSGTARIRRIKPIQKPKKTWGTMKPVQKPKQTRPALSEYWQGRFLP
jgi:hypothetical protein